MMKYKLPIFISLIFIMFFAFVSITKAVTLTDAPVVNGVINSAWQYQGSIKGVAWYMKGTYFSNPDGSLQFATSAEFSAYLAEPDVVSPTGGLTSTVPMGPNGLNPGWQDQGGGWYFKNPTYSDAYGSVQFNSLNELNAYLAAEQAKKVALALPPTTGCTGFENNAACRPEWAEAVKVCITGTLHVSSDNTNGQCNAMINMRPTLIQTCNAIISDGPCRPERVNPYASAGVAIKAETIAKLKGYSNTTCSAIKVPLPGPFIDPNTGLQYYYSIECTINGKTGIGAEYIVNATDYWWSSLNDYLTGKTTTVPTTGTPTTGGTTNTPVPPVVTHIPSSVDECYKLPEPTDVTTIRAMADCMQSAATQASITSTNKTTTQIAQSQANYVNQIKAITSSYVGDYIKTINSNVQTVPSTSQTSIPSLACSGSLDVNLKLGSTGTDVNTLTSYLTSKGFYQTSQSTFDQTVFDAVVAFQDANKTAILTPVGLTEGTGFVGASTRKFINNDICPQTGGTVDGVTFTSNVSGIMYVGDTWNITVTGLNPNETIYATGGKKVNGVVPQDKTPYIANNLGVYSKTTVHTSDVVGDWVLVWTRADGSIIKTLTFSVQTKEVGVNGKALFTSNVSGTMYVGDPWNIVVTGLNPNETIYATGGKKVNGVVPQDKTPYVADNLGIYSKISSHAQDVIGDWVLVWTRADGSNLGTLTFSVKPFTLPFITSVTSTNIKVGSNLQILGGNFNQSNTVAELVNSQGASVTLPVTNMTTNTMNVSVPSGLTAGAYTLQLHFVGTGVNFGKISNKVSMNVTI